MSEVYDSIIDHIIQAEKGYVDHKDDRGGKTNWGITEVVARANGYRGHMKDMPESFAREIYVKRYIKDPKFDLVIAVDPKIGLELVDTGVNMGPAVPSMWFQRILNVFNAKGSKYPDLFVDGKIGPATIDAFKKFLAWRGKEGSQTFLKALNCLQGARYIEITEKNENQESFVYGWIKERVSL